MNVDSEKLTAFEEILYGKAAVAADPTNNIEASDAVSARLPLPDEIATFFSAEG